MFFPIFQKRRRMEVEEAREDAPASVPATSGLVKLNVGGRVFETTASTLSAAGPDALLSAVAASAAASYPAPFFLDRDPDLFGPLLSLLRTGRLPSSDAPRRLLSLEALHYGLHPLLVAALRPAPLSGLSASLSSVLVPPSSPLPSALHPLPDGSLLLGHGGQISSFDHSLSLASTLRTHLDPLRALRPVSPLLAVAGSPSSPGLHLFHLPSSRHHAALLWSDPSDLRVRKAAVAAIATPLPSSPSLFAAFECPHRENAILAFDRASLLPVAEIGRQSGSATKTTAPTKLAEIDDGGRLLFAAAVAAGAFGYSGYMRLWDPRSGSLVWETVEPGAARSARFGDAFSDADVDATEGRIYKVCSRSGDVGFADLRMLGEDPWVYLEERSVRPRGGEGSFVRCHRGQVFVGREGAVEVLARAPAEEGVVWRRCCVDSEADEGRGAIAMMELGGDRLFLSREGLDGVEVWESSALSGAVRLP